MITRMNVTGYRSLVDVTLDLDRLNLFIGPNATGKSSLIELFGLLRDAASGFLALGLKGRGGYLSVRSAMPGVDSVHVSLDLAVPQDTEQRVWRYVIELSQFGAEALVQEERLGRISGDRGLFGADVPATPLLDRRQNLASFVNETTGQADSAIELKEAGELAISQVKQPLHYPGAYVTSTLLSWIQVYDPIYSPRFSAYKLPRVATSDLVLYQDGSNLANVLSTRLSDDGFQADFDHYVKLVFPDFRRVHFKPDATGEGRILFSWHSEYANRPLYLWELSDGQYKYLCLLAILLRPPPNVVICLDEPEVGLHPRMLGILSDLIRSAADSAQVIVTTHSPNLVSHFRAEEIIVAESQQGRSTFEKLSQRDLSDWLAEFSLGELMSMGELERHP